MLSLVLGVEKHFPQFMPAMSTETPSDSIKNTASIVEGRAIDDARPIKVRVMGAGLSGIIACIRLLQRIKNIDLRVYEKNEDIGGTWFENRYPGCACGKCVNHRKSALTRFRWSKFQCLENRHPFAHVSSYV